jgi:hypothetical protein
MKTNENKYANGISERADYTNDDAMMMMIDKMLPSHACVRIIFLPPLSTLSSR